MLNVIMNVEFRCVRWCASACGKCARKFLQTEDGKGFIFLHSIS
jgi:hypothetical protein